MSVVDLIIIGIVILGGITGAKNGFLKQIVSFIGFFLVVVLAFLFKGIISNWLFMHLPFFKFGGIFKGVTVLNIFIYEVIGFLIALSILLIIYRILLKVTGLIEKIFEATIILSIPSKILGAIVGMLEYFVLVFIILYITGLPFFDINLLNASNFRKPILNNTPILSSTTKDMVNVFDDFNNLKGKYTTNIDANTFNLEALDLVLKYKVTDVTTIDNLIGAKKLRIKNVDTVLNKYR